MTACMQCGETIEPGFDVCWKCGTHVDGTPPDPGFLPPGVDPAQVRELDCLRCQTPMQFVRRMRFHEGSQWHGVFLDAGHLLGNRESFDVHACPHCGKVEFYLTL